MKNLCHRSDKILGTTCNTCDAPELEISFTLFETLNMIFSFSDQKLPFTNSFYFTKKSVPAKK